tara:strand:- start:191 stop:595 length:405 start_codon:yes stop_codon:yes gene_type:complete
MRVLNMLNDEEHDLFLDYLGGVSKNSIDEILGDNYDLYNTPLPQVAKDFREQSDSSIGDPLFETILARIYKLAFKPMWFITKTVTRTYGTYLCANDEEHAEEIAKENVDVEWEELTDERNDDNQSFEVEHNEDF